MALLNDHYITILGPQEEIKRFAVDFNLVPGEYDLGKGAVVDGEEMPSAALGMGYYTVTKCGVYCCGAIIEFTVRGEFFQPSCLFRQFCSDYPRLSFQWRYCLELDNGVGYVDAQGDHRYCENFSRDSAGSDDWIYELRTPERLASKKMTIATTTILTRPNVPSTPPS